jgi:hypothetical protein
MGKPVYNTVAGHDTDAVVAAGVIRNVDEPVLPR